jgi:hypothetical protein
VSRTSFFCTDTLGVRNAWSLRALQKHIIKVTMSIVCYEGGSKEQVKRSEVYGKLLEGNGMEREGLPATLVPVERLARKGLLFEIEAMAVVAGYEAK